MSIKVIDEHVSHPDQAFRFLRFACAPQPGRWHRHPQLELTWIERGAGIRYVGDSVAPFMDGDLALIGPDLPHIWDIAPQDGEAVDVTVLQFPEQLCQLAQLPEMSDMHDVLRRSRAGLRIDGACREDITALLAQMRAQTPLRRLGLMIEVMALLAEHPDAQHRLASAPQRAAGSMSGKRIDPVIDWIHANLGHTLRAEEGARVACITPAAFSRFFQRETGKPFSVYVSQARCSAACLVLLRSDKPVALIAQECGFATQSNFNRQFLAHTGLTPRDYRRQR